MRLHDGVRHEHDAVEHHGDAEDGHELRGKREVRAGVAAKQGDDGLCQHDEADGTRHGDETHKAQRRILHGAHAAAVLQRQAVRNGRDDGDGDAGNEGTGEIEDGLAVVINTLDDVRALLRVARGIDEAVHDRRRIEQVDDLQTGCAERDGHGNGQQALERLACGSCLPLRAAELACAAARLAEEVEGREHRADRHTRDGAGSGERAVAEAIHDEPGKAEAEEELAQGLDDLADGRRSHVPLPLEEAAAGGDVAHEEHGRAERKDGPHGIRVLHHVGQLLRDDQHQRRADDTDGQEGHEGDAVDLTHLFAVVQRAGLGDHAAHGDGQTRRGDHEQHGVDVIGRGEIAVVCLADEAVERDFEEHADDLDDHRRQRQHRRTGQEILLLRCLFFQHSSVLSVGISCALLRKCAA